MCYFHTRVCAESNEYFDSVLVTLREMLAPHSPLVNTVAMYTAVVVVFWCTVVLVHGQVTIIFVVSVCLSVCLFVCVEFFSAVFDPTIKLGHMLYVWI